MEAPYYKFTYKENDQPVTQNIKFKNAAEALENDLKRKEIEYEREHVTESERITPVYKFVDFLTESALLEYTEPKDKMRLDDIKRKAGGDLDREISLASTMAKLIKNPEKAARRAEAAEDLYGPNHEVTEIFMDRAEELGAPTSKRDGTKVEPASQRKDLESVRGLGSRPAPILPVGSQNLQSGDNRYFNMYDNASDGDGVIEVWKTQDGKYKYLITSGTSAMSNIGAKHNFTNDQSSSFMFSAELVDWIEVEYARELIPLYGKSASGYVYK